MEKLNQLLSVEYSTVVPQYPLIQYALIQLSVVYRGPEKKEN
jgi:hypothetical protein